MSPQPRLRLATALVGLALCGLPAAIAQIQPTPSPGMGQPSTAPPPNGTPAPSSPADSPADSRGIFAPSSPNGLGAGEPVAPSAPGNSSARGTPVPDQAGGSPATGVGAGGAPPSAFGSVNDFSAELGVRQLIDPNNPDFQPLSVSDFRLVQPERTGKSSPDRFGLGGGAVGPIGETTNYRERFARALAGPPEASLPASGSDGVSGALRQGGGRLAWPAIQSSCPDSVPPPGSSGHPSCPG
jgi:hypothetical protein